jgi:23S rRNA pseudouridine1911/1915/1917 synthase
MNRMLKEGRLQKTYWAVVTARPPEVSGHLVQYLTRNEKQNKSYVHDREVKESKRAELKYRLVGQGERYWYLEVDLMTGRHHQIRAQLAALGCPIKGDLKYGAPRSNPDGSIHLHSRKLVFPHPVREETVTILADPPDDPLWNHFLRIQPEESR